MNTILDFMRTNHGTCDTLFAATEVAVAQKRWIGARSLFERLRAAMSLHATLEEQILFPALEGQKGYCVGPTRFMRMEHDQMRGLLNRMETAIAEGKESEYLGLSETLNMLMQQHNRKEERLLDSLSDHALAETRDKLIREMTALTK
jgi:hemerythrin-like domain-containing protein